MNEPRTPPQQPIVKRQEKLYCPCCGARLVPHFYFCLACATPYKSPDSVLPPLTVRPLSEGMLIATKAPHVWPLFWTYLAVVLAVGIGGYLIFGHARWDITIIVQTVVLFAATSVWAAIHWRSLLVQLRRLGFLHPAAWVGLLSLVPLLAINYGYHSFISELLPPERVVSSEDIRESGLSPEALVFFFCISPAILEEIAFRGLVQHWLQVAIRPIRALVLASALFTAMHFSVISAPYLFAVGMTLGWVKWKTGSLYPSILMHFVHNLVVLEYFH